MFIPERQREALMRLTMCARDECMMCIYQPKDDRCKDIATTAMHILANALKVDDDAPQTEEYDFRDDQEYNDRWDTDCDRYVITNDEGDKAYNCMGCPQTDCGWGEPNE